MNVIVTTLTQAGTTQEAAEQAAAAIAAGPTAVVVNHHPAVDAAAAVTALAGHGLEDTLDVHLATPDADQWTIDEIRERAITRAHLRPYERNHIIITDATRASSAIHDTLLKTIEEPPTPTTFWLCAPTDTDAFPATLRGRIRTTIDLPRASDAELVDHLQTASGASTQDATRALEHAHFDLALASAALAHNVTDALERAATTSWRTTTPQATSDTFLLNLATLARAATATRKVTAGPPTKKGNAARLDLPKLTPPQRARLRALLRSTLTTWERGIVRDALEHPTRAGVTRARSALHIIDDARVAMHWNTSTAVILASTLTALNALPDT